MTFFSTQEWKILIITVARNLVEGLSEKAALLRFAGMITGRKEDGHKSRPYGIKVNL